MDEPKDRIRLIKPAGEDDRAVIDYRDEFLRNHEDIHGSGGLAKATTYTEWIRICKDSEHESTVPEDRVPATQYLAIRERDNELVGMLQVRHYLNDFLKEQGGHIGYSVRKSQRRKGYATEMLHIALSECKKLGLQRVVLTCDPLNIGSASVIKANGGIYEKRIIADGRKFDHYWITLV